MNTTPAPEAGDERSVPDSLVENPLAGTKYTAISLIGRGGMGEVYLADHDELGKRFVVKLLHAEMSADPRLVDRVRVEAQALAKLRHPCIVDVIDFGTTPSKRPYLVMERLTGVTLWDELRQRGAFTPGDAVRVVRQLLSALVATHAVGIIHRDVKLSNLFVHQRADNDPVLKVLDFGLAKVMDASVVGTPAPLLYPTEEGVVVGTPRYLAPEAWAGKGVDHRADIYATGVVLYHLLAGRGPWDDVRQSGKLLQAQMKAQFEPPSAYAPGPVSVELDLIVKRALSSNLEERFQTARSFDEALAITQAAAASPIGWMHTTMLRELPPKSVSQAADGSMERLSGDTERDIPPTEEVGARPARSSNATEELPSDLQLAAVRPDSASTHPERAPTRTALRIQAPMELVPHEAETLASADAPPGRHLLVVVGITAGAAAAIGVACWALLSWFGGP